MLAKELVLASWNGLPMRFRNTVISISYRLRPTLISGTYRCTGCGIFTSGESRNLELEIRAATGFIKLVLHHWSKFNRMVRATERADLYDESV
jgi:hypothetical protein